ncbi:MAG TPA: phosphatase PAP2 family protein [Phnomibacter sp.]|nr:phosphatase PAP2 family protein [Phnomibacter sp.]
MQHQSGDRRSKKPIAATLILFLISFGIWVFLYGRGESFRAITGWHIPAADLFFRYITHLGDGIFILVLAAVLVVFRRTFLSIGIVASYLLSGLMAQVGKRLLNMPRPKAFFTGMGETVYEVPGVDVHLAGSFPSGHTASVFALAVFLILALPYRWYSWLILLVAAMVGYSRVYLSQHFPIDVWAGAAIGTVSGIAVHYFLERRMGRK